LNHRISAINARAQRLNDPLAEQWIMGKRRIADTNPAISGDRRPSGGLRCDDTRFSD
jgi:hypothetical protein